MILNAKISRLKVDAELAWFDGNEARGRRLDEEIVQLMRENERRLVNAQNKLATFPAEIQDEAWLNASQTAINPSQTKFFRELGGEAFQLCEFWEAAAESAQFLVDCN